MSVVELSILDYAVARNRSTASVLTHTTRIEEMLVTDSLLELHVRMPEKHHICVVIPRQGKEIVCGAIRQEMSKSSFAVAVAQVEILISNLVVSFGF
jgi:hypothetical protein